MCINDESDKVDDEVVTCSLLLIIIDELRIGDVEDFESVSEVKTDKEIDSDVEDWIIFSDEYRVAVDDVGTKLSVVIDKEVKDEIIWDLDDKLLAVDNDWDDSKLVELDKSFAVAEAEFPLEEDPVDFVDSSFKVVLCSISESSVVDVVLG